MSPIEQYRALARYNRWLNRKLYTVAAQLGDDETKRDRGAFFGSLHGTFNHILLADRIWMLRLTGDAERFSSRSPSGELIQVSSLSQVLYEDFDVLHRERERTDEDILAWSYALDDAALDQVIEYGTSNGEPQRHAAWWAISQLFNHQAHHRGQATTLLMQAGSDPGVTDLIAMLREEAITLR